MKSLIIGIARTGSQNDFVLNQDTRYISMCGSKPEVSFSIGCGQFEFLKMINDLRYRDADPDSSSEAIAYFTQLTSKIFNDIKYLKIDENEDSPLHIRLAMSPLELAQIPFEFSHYPKTLANGTTPMLANPKRIITLTREVRQESEANYVWPYKPRILFVWAQPEMDVPFKEHYDALESIVKPFATPLENSPYPEPDIDEYLTELPNASLKSIKQQIEKGIAEKKPYTHIHILAHGGQKLVFGQTEFRLILCKGGTTDSKDKIDGKSLAEVLNPSDQSYHPTIVTLAVCDSGNVGSTILPSGSLAYQLHTKGIPCIFASQFPLTQIGSVQLVKNLYSNLINGHDPRMALYEARIDLNKDQTHDWASLVAYARFPNDIDEQLQTANLKLLFGSMKVTNAWVDHVFRYWEKIETGKKEKALQELETRLDRSIAELSKFLNEENKKESCLITELLQSEHLGLLGSAHKRKAEYLFRSIEFNPDKKTDLLNLSIKSLEKAKDFYDYGLAANPASHWNTMQFLSLNGVSTGNLADYVGLWHVTKHMAERDEKNTKDEALKIWAWGTLAELHMLKPLINSSGQMNDEIKTATTMAKEYLQNMADSDVKYNYAKESTARQFDRYIHWWPNLYHSNYPNWLKESALQIRGVLPSLEELMLG